MNTGTLESTTLASGKEIKSQVSRAGDRVTATISNHDGDLVESSIDEHGGITILVRAGGREPRVRIAGSSLTVRVVSRAAKTEAANASG